MKGWFGNWKQRAILSLVVLTILVLGFTCSRLLAEESSSDKAEPIVIKAKNLELDETRSKITFLGNVKAKSKDFTINCREMVIYYVSEKGPGKQAGIGTKIDKIVARGDVRIQRQEGGVATSEEAIYFWGEEKLVLTGNPKVTQGNDFVQGHKIVLYLKENRSVVEGSGDEAVKAVIFPREAKKP